MSSVHTFADLTAESWRLSMSYARSELSAHPQTGIQPSDAESRWFYKLPLEERAVYIAHLFTVTPPSKFDGERSENMHILLTRRSTWSPTAPADRAYTQQLFSLLSGYSDAQLRRFAQYVGGDVSQFHKNLEMWETLLKRDAERSNHAMQPTTGRRTASLSMTTARLFHSTRAPASGG